MGKLKDISVLLFVGRYRCPEAFSPAHACLAASSLGNPTIDDGMADFTLGAIVGRLHPGSGQQRKKVSAQPGHGIASPVFWPADGSAVAASGTKSCG